MRRGVIALGIAPRLAWHGRSRLSDGDFAADLADGGDASVDFPNFVDVDSPAVTGYLATVGDLAARLRVERCLAQHYGGASVGEIAHGHHCGVRLEGVVSNKGDVAVLCPSSFGERIRSDADLA